MNVLIRSVCFVAAVNAIAMQAVAANYVFSNVVDSTSLSAISSSFPNNNPAVANGVAAFYDDSATPKAIYDTVGGTHTKLAERGVPTPIGTFQLVRTASPPGSFVSASGREVAFHGALIPPNETSPVRGIFQAGSGGLRPVAMVGDTIAGSTFTNFGNSPAQSGNDVAFIGRYGTTNGVFLGNGGGLTTIVKSGDPAPSGVFGGFGKSDNAVSLSDGRFAFYGTYSTGPGIFTSNGGPLTTIAKKGDAAPTGTFANFNDPSISGEDVAFLANYGSFSGLFKGNGGPLTQIAQIGQNAPRGSFLAFDEPAIADSVISFQGHYLNNQTWETGLFVGDGGPLETVIKTGDPLFGSTVTDLSFGRFGFDQDGSGRLAFRYALSNGVSGLAFAQPVPEQTTFSMIVVAFVAIARRRCVSCRCRLNSTFMRASRCRCDASMANAG